MRFEPSSGHTERVHYDSDRCNSLARKEPGQTELSKVTSGEIRSTKFEIPSEQENESNLRAISKRSSTKKLLDIALLLIEALPGQMKMHQETMVEAV